MARIRGPFKMCVFVMTRHSHHGMFSSRCFELPAHVAEVPPLIAQTHAIKIVRRRRPPWHSGTARELVSYAATPHTGGFWEKNMTVCTVWTLRIAPHLFPYPPDLLGFPLPPAFPCFDSPPPNHVFTSCLQFPRFPVYLCAKPEKVKQSFV